MVLRDENGAFVASQSFWLQGAMQVDQVKALCTMRATEWILSLGYKCVIFEKDVMVVNKAIDSGNSSF